MQGQSLSAEESEEKCRDKQVFPELGSFEVNLKLTCTHTHTHTHTHTTTRPHTLTHKTPKRTYPYSYTYTYTYTHTKHEQVCEPKSLGVYPRVGFRAGSI